MNKKVIIVVVVLVVLVLVVLFLGIFFLGYLNEDGKTIDIETDKLELGELTNKEVDELTNDYLDGAFKELNEVDFSVIES